MNKNWERVAMVGLAFPFKGGMAALKNKLAIELQKTGKDVEIFGFKKLYPYFIFRKEEKITDKAQIEDFYNKYQLKIHNFLKSWNPNTWRFTAKLISSRKPDIVIYQYWVAFLAVVYGKIAKYIKKNNSNIVEIAIVNSIYGKHKKIQKIFFKYFSRYIDGFIFLSEKVAHEFNELNINKPYLIVHHPLYDQYGELIPKEKALNILNLPQKIFIDNEPVNIKYILFFGQIKEYKGLDLLLQALANTDPSIHLIVAGDFFQSENVFKDIIDKLNLKDRVAIFDKCIPDSEVPVFFSAADLVVMPYKVVKQSGITRIALRYNKPFITTDTDILDIIADKVCDTDFIITTDPMEISKAINTFFSDNPEDKIKAKKWVQAQNILANILSWEKMITAIDELYKLNNKNVFL